MCDVAHLLYVIEICLVILDFVSPIVHVSGLTLEGSDERGRRDRDRVITAGYTGAYAECATSHMDRGISHGPVHATKTETGFANG